MHHQRTNTKNTQEMGNYNQLNHNNYIGVIFSILVQVGDTVSTSSLTIEKSCCSTGDICVSVELDVLLKLNNQCLQF